MQLCRRWFVIAIFAVPCLGNAQPQNIDALNEQYAEAHMLINAGKPEKGAVLIKECAAHGHGGCMNVLGGLLYEGRGIPKDVKNAIYWQKKAYRTKFESGLAGVYAAIQLAGYYGSGDEMTIDRKKAFLWIERSEQLIANPNFPGTPKMAEAMKKDLAAFRVWLKDSATESGN